MQKSLDVYEEVHDSKLIARRGGGGGEIGRTMDKFENYDFNSEIDDEDDEEIDEDEAFNEEDKLKYSEFFSDNESEEQTDNEEHNEAPEFDLLASLQDDYQRDDFLNVNSEESEFELGDDQIESIVNVMGKKSQKRKIVQIEGVGAESEFNVAKRDKKMGMADLLDVVQDQGRLGTLKKQIAALKSKEAALVNPPLAPRMADRVERQAAYAQSKAAVGKWIPIVAQNRRAETLIFPMGQESVPTVSTATLMNTSNPSNAMESEIEKILVGAGLQEDKLKEIEELALNKLSTEEVAARHAELAKTRALLFFQEQKQKKIAKIKSKTYRKIHRNDKKKQEVSIEELEKLDPVAAQEMKDKMDFQRAKERMTLKHKNTGRWAKEMLKKGFRAEESEKQIADQLQKHALLTKKMVGRNSDDDEEDDDDDSENVDEHQVVKDGLQKLNELNEEPETDNTGLLGMKFMKRGLEKQKVEIKKSIDRARKELEAYERGETLEDVEDVDDQFNGRKVYAQVPDKIVQVDIDGVSLAKKDTVIKSTGSTIVAKDLNQLFPVESFEIEELDQVTFSGDVNSANNIAKPIINPKREEQPRTVAIKAAKKSENSQKANSKKAEQYTPSETGNPWIESSDSKLGVKKSIASTFKSYERNSKTEKSLHKISKRIEAVREEDQEEEDDHIASPINGYEDVAAIQQASTKVVLSSDDQDSDYDTMIHETDAKKLSSFDIMKMAFANDNVQAVN
jgi:U3 small nucleolar RNA-associated protein 14